MKPQSTSSDVKGGPVRKRRRLMGFASVVGVVAAVLAVISFVGTPRTVSLRIEGPPGLAVRGYVEADGHRQIVTTLPFRFDGRVRRLSYEVVPVGGEAGVWAEMIERERRVATNSCGPGKPAIRAWVRHEPFGSGATWQENFDPQADTGWSLPPQ